MLNSRHGFWKVGRRAGAWLSGGWAFCFLGAASRLLSHRWGTVKLDDCNLPGRIVNAIIFALLSSRATASAALIHSSGFSVGNAHRQVQT